MNSFGILTDAYITRTDKEGDFTALLIGVIKQMEKEKLITVNEPQELVSRIATHLASTKSVHFNSFMQGGKETQKITNND